MANLRLEDIYKTYDNGVEAVKNFNLKIDNQEFMIIVGPSGCGKSTVLRMIAGLEQMSKGDIYIDDKLVNDVEPMDRDIAMVFQDYALYPHMSVYENMAFALKLRKLDDEKISEQVLSAAKILSIEDLLERKPNDLSGGQRQRVAMGRAIVRSPKVLLMDEPLSSLDAKLRVQMRSELSKLHQRLENTIIYVTHDQIEAMTLGDRIVVMNEGEIQQVDTPLNLYKNPINKFVAGFIGSPQMNFIDGVVIEENGQIKVDVEFTKIILNEYQSALLKDKYLNETVTLGIRPEDLYEDNTQSKPVINTFKVKVNVYEMIGAEVYLYSETSVKELIARANSNTKTRVGDEITLHFDANDLHIFDKKSGKALR